MTNVISTFFQVHGANGSDQLGQDQGHGEASEGSHEKVSRKGKPHQVLTLPLISSTQGMAEEETKGETKKKANEGRDCGFLVLQPAQKCCQPHHTRETELSVQCQLPTYIFHVCMPLSSSKNDRQKKQEIASLDQRDIVWSSAGNANYWQGTGRVWIW